MSSRTLLQGIFPTQGSNPGLLQPKNTEVGSLSLLQQTFLAKESNRGLLHCRRILDPSQGAWPEVEPSSRGGVSAWGWGLYLLGL